MRFLIILLSIIFAANAFALPTPEFVPGQLVIKYKQSYGTMSGGNNVMGALGKYNARIADSYTYTLKSQKGLSGTSSLSSEVTAIVTFDQNINVNDVQRELSSISDVVYAEPNYYVFTSSVEGEGLAATNALPQVVIDGSSYDVNEVVVAVLDTGVDYNHASLASGIWENSDEIASNGIDDDGNGYIDDIRGYDFYNHTYGSGDNDPMDDHNHGTHVSGIVLGYANTQVGLTDIKGNIKVMPVKFLNSSGSGNQYDAATAIRYAVDNGAKVINCSWGYFVGSSVLQDAINYAIANNVFVVASAGNNNWSNYQYPASYTGVIAVSAVDNFNHKASFSNYGDYINLCAPGVSIRSTLKSNSYGYMSGTSQSAPFVSQKLAYLLGVGDSSDFSSVYNMVNSYTFDVTDPLNSGSNLVGWDQYTGYGKMDHSSAAISMVNGGFSQTNATTLSLEKVFNYPNPATTISTFGFYLKGSNADITIKIFDTYGNLIRTYEQFVSASDAVYNKTISWDLKDEDGEEVPNGTYIYLISADAGGTVVSKKQKAVVLR